MRSIAITFLFFTICVGCSKDFLSYHNCDIDDSERVFRLEELHEMNSDQRNALAGKVIVVEGTYAHSFEGIFLVGNSDNEIVFALELSGFPTDSARTKTLAWGNSERMSGSQILVKGKFDPTLHGHLALGEAGIKEVCFFGKK